MHRSAGQRCGLLTCALLVLSTVGSSDLNAKVLRVGQDGPGLQATIDISSEGDIVEVPPGEWVGTAQISHQITLRGTGGIIDGGGQGSVIVVSAPGTVIENLQVRHSGSDLTGLQPDSCIYLQPEAVGAIVQDNQLSDCAFGIWVHTTPRVHILRNQVRGREHIRPTDRGNGIQLFDASHLVVSDNVVSFSRDGIYISATEDSLISGNRLEHLRYGVHYMYSYRNTLRNNLSADNLIGFALMESRDLIVEDNVARDNERNGILFRDAEDCIIRRNELIRNGQGLFFFSSIDNVIEHNRIVHNDIGAKIWAGSQNNQVSSNAFIGNRRQIFYVGADDLIWGGNGRGNYWSDYVGWDQNSDGIGDRFYRMESFSSTLVYRYPAASMLLHSPALEMLSYIEDKMPVLRVPTVIDTSPLMREPIL